MTAAGGPGWLIRWARRKAAARKVSAPPAALPAAAPSESALAERAAHPPPAGDPAMAPTAAPATLPAAEVQAEDLPPIESLGYESDFSPYFRPGVPEALQRQALRKLWRTNPVLANLDGLNDYDEDYSAVGMVDEAVDTLFQIGRGMADSEVASEPAPPEATATAQPSAAASRTKEVSVQPGATSSSGEAGSADGAPPGKTA